MTERTTVTFVPRETYCLSKTSNARKDVKLTLDSVRHVELANILALALKVENMVEK